MNIMSKELKSRSYDRPMKYIDVRFFTNCPQVVYVIYREKYKENEVVLWQRQMASLGNTGQCMPVPSGPISAAKEAGGSLVTCNPSNTGFLYEQPLDGIET